jgi:hypothetical protein
MGLRLVAHYLDRSEAVVVSSMLDAAGVPNFIEIFQQVWVRPLKEIAMGGFRLMVAEEDLAVALEVLPEAQANPAPCDELLTVRHFPVTFAVFHLAQLMLIGLFLWVPMRQHQWRRLAAPES